MRKLFTLAALLLLMVVSANAKLVTDYSIDFSTKAGQTFSNWKAENTDISYAEDGTLTLKNETATTNYLIQALGVTGIPTTFEDGNYTVTYKIKGSVAGTLYAKLGDWGTGSGQNITFTTEYTDVAVKYSNITSTSSFLLLQWGAFVGEIDIQSITVTHEEGDNVKLYPANCINTLKAGAGVSWSGISFPFEISNSTFWGSHDANTNNYVDISAFKTIELVLESTQQNEQYRAFVWNDQTEQRDILYFYPKGEAVTDWKTACQITAAGTLVVNIEGYSKLLGIKPYGAGGTVTIACALKNAEESTAAVDEARTYSSSKILDFSQTTDVEAYIETETAGQIAMKKVTGAVPAGTGLVLKQVNDKSVISIPVVAEATEDVTGNLLVATTAETNVEAVTGANRYVLAGTGDKLGWYAITAAKPATLAANKCYLSVSFTGPEAKAFIPLWGDDATAVEAVKTVETVADGAFYTVAGVKVAQPQKGNLYIHNGKTIVF